MKKIIIIFVLMILIPINVNAITVGIDYQDNLYSHRESWNHHYSGQLGYIYLENQIGYCLEPFKVISTDYKVDNSVLPNSLLDYYKLVAYYGYATHLDNIYYYMASQELMWRTNSAVVKVYWTSTSSTSDLIDISQYKNEITEKVSKARVKPSFDSETITGDYGEIIKIEDVNHVLDEYEILNTSKNKIWKENNQLYIQILDMNPVAITLQKRMKFGTDTKGYIPTSSGQSLATFSMDETIESSFNISPNSYKSKIKITRFANDSKVEGKIKFKIYQINTGKFIHDGEIFETDEFGNYISNFKLEKGTYEIFNIEIPNGYIFYDFNTSFQIKENNQLNNFIYEINDYLDVPVGLLTISDSILYSNYKIEKPNSILKLYAKENIYNENYDLIYHKNDLVEILKTDYNGMINYQLIMGKYELIDEENNHYDISIDFIDYYTKEIKININITHSLAYSNVSIVTKLEEDNKFLPLDLKYYIYAKEDIYLENRLIYKKDELIYIVNSNRAKEIILPNGKYYIKEEDNSYEEPFEIYDFNYDGNDIILEIIKHKKIESSIILKEDDSNVEIENKENCITSLPNTYDTFHIYSTLSFLLICIGLLLNEITKDN